MESAGTILLVDDDKAFRTLTSGLLEEEGYYVKTCENAEKAMEQLADYSFDLVLTDLVMEGTNGLEFLQNIRECCPRIMVIMVTGYGSIDSAVEAMKLGAHDYLTKPCSNEELLIKIKKAMELKRDYEELQRLRTELSQKYQFGNIIGKSDAMLRLYALLEQVADTDSTIFISGETGTGKELVAKAIHYNSRRKSKPFVAVNCAALPESLLESELFGHEKGAFSGAIKQKPGRFELANHGTLFLDEIGDMPLSTQVKLLRVLQEKSFERLGGTVSIKADIRLISATNLNLEQEVKNGNFRKDLYFRINVMPIHLPPLRERKTDIPLLAEHFANKFSVKLGKNIRISQSALQLLTNYHWPGNIREMENVIERAVLLCRGDMIEIEHLLFNEKKEELAILQDAMAKELTEEKMNAIYARMVLNNVNGNKKLACEKLGINFKTLQKRLG